MGCVVNVWTRTKSQGLGVLYWSCDTHPNLNTHTHTPMSSSSSLSSIDGSSKSIKMILESTYHLAASSWPSLEYSSHTVQWASWARVICHWFPPSSLSLPDSLAPSHCTQHKKLTSSYTLLMHMHNNPLFSCPLVISPSLSFSLSLSFLLYLLRRPLASYSSPIPEISSQVTVLWLQ